MPTKRGKRPEEEFFHYVTSVTGWEHMYGLSASGQNRSENNPYREFSVLKLNGEVIRPKKFKLPNAIIQLSSQKGLLEEEDKTPSKSIGMLSSRDDILDAYVFVPTERMAELLTLAASGRVQAVAFTGTKLKWRKGTIINIELMTEFIEEDW